MDWIHITVLQGRLILQPENLTTNHINISILQWKEGLSSGNLRFAK